MREKTAEPRTRFEKIEENIQNYNDLKNSELWLYYNYYSPGKRQVDCYLDGKQYILFSTNNYLGLSRNSKVVNAAIGAVKECGVGTGASMAVSGGTTYHKKLEKELADFYKAEDCVVLSSGFMANGAIVSTFAKQGLKVFCDKYLHVSFANSLKLHGIEPIRFEHNDVADLGGKMSSAISGDDAGSVIITESVFSQHGEIAKVDKIAELAKKYNSTLVVDDAHGLGTIGENGHGILEHFNLSLNDVHVITGAMNKSLGSQGGYIVARKDIADMVRMKAYELIFTSSLPAMSMAAACAALQEIKTNRDLFNKLRANILHARSALKNIGLNLPDSLTPILPVIVGPAKKAAYISKKLQENGIIVIPIIPPAVPENASRLRIQITAEHGEEDIDKLVSSLKEVI